MSKIALHAIATDHFGTLRDDSTDRISISDILQQFIFPGVAAGAGVLSGFKLLDPNGVVAAVSIVAALLCSMGVFLFELRLETRKMDDNRLGEKDFKLLDETFQNVMWAIVVGLGLALYLVVCDAIGALDEDGIGVVLAGVAVFAGVHFLMVILMSLKRLRRAYLRIAAGKS